MKILFSLILLIFISKDCKQQQSQSSLESQEHIAIIYEASTRGFYEKTWITKDSISFSGDRDLVKVVTSKCGEEDWNTLSNFLKEINLEEIPEMESPSKKYQVDGAAMATLAIKINQEAYKTQVFDHGYPPKAISKIVNKVLSMKELIVKH